MNQDPAIEHYLCLKIYLIIIILNIFAFNLKRRKCILCKFLICNLVNKSKNKCRLRKKILCSIFYGGANSETAQNSHEKGLKYILTNEWLSNIEIDEYLGSIEEGSEVTIHHSDVALLLQGGAGEFADTNHTHPS